MKAHREVWLYSVFNLGAPRPLYTRECPGTHCIGGRFCSQGLSGRVRKISGLQGSDARTVQLNNE